MFTWTVWERNHKKTEAEIMITAIVTNGKKSNQEGTR
jgi:hypothetical protein